MDKDELYIDLKTQFKVLFPNFKFKEKDFECLYNSSLLDVMIFKSENPVFYEFIWRKCYVWIFEKIIKKKKNKKLRFSYKIHEDIYHDSINKICYVKFRC